MTDRMLDKYAEQFKDILSSARGVVTKAVIVQSERSFSFANYRKMLRWTNFEHVSFKPSDDDVVVLEPGQ